MRWRREGWPAAAAATRCSDRRTRARARVRLRASQVAGRSWAALARCFVCGLRLRVGPRLGLRASNPPPQSREAFHSDRQVLSAQRQGMGVHGGGLQGREGEGKGSGARRGSAGLACARAVIHVDDGCPPQASNLSDSGHVLASARGRPYVLFSVRREWALWLAGHSATDRAARDSIQDARCRRGGGVP